MYPVEVAYLEKPTPDYVMKSAEVAWNINLQVLQRSPFSRMLRGLLLESKALGIFSYF